MTSFIPLRDTVGYSLQASKWQKLPLLIDLDEMKFLLAALEPFWMIQISGLVPVEQEIISKEAFLQVYEDYITTLKNGQNPSNPLMRAYFSAVWTTRLDALYAVKVNEKQCLVKVMQPVVQLQAHRCDYSFADGTFRSMVMGIDSISWGIQFSYPHLYQDENLQVLTVREGPQFPNTSLFKRMQQWMRSHTIATPFEVEGKKVNVPIRLGKNCLKWINQHPHLQAKGIRVGQNYA